jgi:hypothetical protein
MKRTPPLDDRLTEEEQRRRIEDMVLRQSEKIRRARAARAKALKVLASKRAAKSRGKKLLKRCKECGAFKFLLYASKREQPL